MEIIFALFLIVLVPFLVLSGPIAFIWLFLVRKQLEDIVEQNARLESTLRRLQQDVFSNKPSETKTGIITIEAEESPFKAEQPEQPAKPIRPAAPVVPFAMPPPPTQSPTPTASDSGVRFRSAEDSGIQSSRTTADWKPKKQPKTSSNTQSWELWIGRNLIGWISVGLLILAAALFIKIAIDMGWITDTLKVLGTAGFGVLLLGVGYYSRRTGLRRFSTMMSSAGIIIVYQAGYASYAIYKLVEFQTASVLMPMIVLAGFLLAWFYRSKLLGTVTILGGLAVPILVTSGEDHYREFFVYLLALNIGTLVLVNLLRRAPIAWIAFFGTQALFWMWHNSYMWHAFDPDEYPVHKLVAALVFQSAFYLVFLSDTIIAALKPIGKKLIPTWDDAMRAVLAPIIFFGAIFTMAVRGGTYDRPEGGFAIFDYDPTQIFLQDNLGILAFIGAAWYALLAVLYSRHLARLVPSPAGGGLGWGRSGSNEGANSPHPSPLPKGEGTIKSPLPSGDTVAGSRYWQAAPSAAVVISLGFVAIGIPLQFDAMWITLGWLTIFAGLWYFGHRQNDKTFIVMSLVFFALGMFRFMREMIDQMAGLQTLLDITPVFNSIALPLLACTIVLIVATVLTNRFTKMADSKWKVIAHVDGTLAPIAWKFNYCFGFTGYMLLGVILSGEAARYLYGSPELWLPYKPEYLFSAFMTGFLFLLSMLLLIVGAAFRSKVITTGGLVGLYFAITMMLGVGFVQRCMYQEAFNNPFSIVLIANSLILLAIGSQSKFVSHRLKEPQYQKYFGIFGIVGLFSLLAILTIEWYCYWFSFADGDRASAVLRSVTLFWALYAFIWIAIGFATRNLPIRVCGMIVLFGTLVKTTLVDSTVSFGYCSWTWNIGYNLENWTLLANPYFLTMLAPVIPTLALAVWTNRAAIVRLRNSSQSYDCGSDVTGQERIAWKVAGIFGLVALLLYLSIECHRYFDMMASAHEILGTASLTLFWTITASMLTLLALWIRSRTLRIISMVLLLIAVHKVLTLDLAYQPEYVVPFWNLYAFPTLTLAAVLIALACLWIYRLPEDSMERKIYRFLAFAAVIFLWFTMSVECFRSVRLMTGAGDQAWQAQMALSILWSVFAGILIAIGFIWRSATLRWMAILLFAATLMKILIVDMAGVNELYRFGAVFALATLLALATWAYQRFKPEESEMQRQET